MNPLFDRLGLPGYIDAHCHFMPDRVFAAVWKWFDDEAPVKWPIEYRGDEASRREALAAAGALRYTTLNYAHRPGMAEGLNDWTLQLVERDPKVIPTGTFFPEEGAPAYLDRVLAADVLQGFKLHLQVGGFDPRDPLLAPCFARIQEAGLPLTIHCGSAPLAGNFTYPEAMAPVLDAFPELVFVIAHMGGFEFEHWLTMAERRPSVYLDTTMIFVDFDLRTDEAHPEFPEALLPRVGALGEKILFGTDFPNIPYRLDHPLTRLDALGFGDDWLKAVLHDNAVEVFGL